MNCPFCNHSQTKVTDSRDTKDGKAIRRRRECEKCRSRFSTYEEIELCRLIVVKRDGRKEEYDSEKIKDGLLRALEKRPIKPEKVAKLIGDVEYEIQSKELEKISSKAIGKIVLDKLKKVDDVAYLRFLSVYRSFGSAESFRKEAEKIHGNTRLRLSTENTKTQKH